MICFIEPQWVKLFVGNNGKSLVPAAILLYVRCGLSANCRAAGVPTLKGTTGTTTRHDFPDVAAKQLSTRPLLRPAEVMETVPGLVVMLVPMRFLTQATEFN